jgi:uncharacterized protein YjbJ (UPF0337 family)
MKIFGFRIKTLVFFGVGFLLGSRAGRGPWDKAMEFWEQFQGRAQSELGNGHLKGRFEEAKGKMKDTFASTSSTTT